MSMSLRDQLVQAGLASKTKARQVGKQQGKQARHANAGDDERRRAAEQAKAAKAARDRELNLKRKAEAERKSERAALRQMVEQNRMPQVDSDDYFNFVDGGKVRRLAVTPERRARIVRGELAIVRDAGHYALVPATVAQRIGERDAKMVVTLDSDAAHADDDDPYRDYVVPDDLVW